MGQKELKVAFLLALRSLQRGSRSSAILTILIIGIVLYQYALPPLHVQRDWAEHHKTAGGL